MTATDLEQIRQLFREEIRALNIPGIAQESSTIESMADAAIARGALKMAEKRARRAAKCRQQ